VQQQSDSTSSDDADGDSDDGADEAGAGGDDTDDHVHPVDRAVRSNMPSPTLSLISRAHHLPCFCHTTTRLIPHNPAFSAQHRCWPS
jgi:hypothetical protein